MDALEFLHKIWAQQSAQEGYTSAFAFLCLRRDDKSWMDIAFKYGSDSLEIPDPQEGDVYFCPNLFARPKRRKELVLPSAFLYADLDRVPPRAEGAELSPSMAWESSPGRYQALWELDKYLRREDHEVLNKQLTYALGADKGGWDITQVLRVPGTINHKYPKKPKVKLLWA